MNPSVSLASLSCSNKMRFLSLKGGLFFLCSHRRVTILRAATTAWKSPLNSRKRAASFAVCYCEDQGLTVRHHRAGRDWTILPLSTPPPSSFIPSLLLCHALLPVEFLAPLIFFHWQISDAAYDPFLAKPWWESIGFYKSRWRAGCWCIAVNVHLKKIPYLHLCFNRSFWAHNCQNWSIPSWRPGSSCGSGSGRRAWSNIEPIWEFRGAILIIPFYFLRILRQSHDLIVSRGIL